MLFTLYKQNLPRGKSIFNVVRSGVDENPTLIPGSALYSDVFMNVAQTLQLTVTDHDGYRSGKKQTVQFNQLSSRSRLL